MEQDDNSSQEQVFHDEQLGCEYVSIQKQCPYFQKAVLVCCNSKCTQSSLICRNPKCQCLSKFHSKCSMLSLQRLIEKIRIKKKVISKQSQASLTAIHDKFYEIIEYLSDIRDKIQNYLQRIGWNDQQKQFMEAFQHGSSAVINGATIADIRKSIHSKASSRNVRVMTPEFYQTGFDRMKDEIQNTLMNQMQLFQFVGKSVSMQFKSDFKRNALDKKTLASITSVKTLEKLHVQWCPNLSKQQITSIISTPFLLLKELRLEYCTNFQPKMIQKVIKNHPNIQYFQYGIDYRRSFRDIQQAQYFMALGKQIDPKFPSVENCEALSKLPNLKNIWIPNSFSEMANNLARIQKLEQIVIGNSSEFNILSPFLIQRLHQKKRLKSITLKSIQSNGLNYIFQDCQRLQSIVLDWCKSMTDQNLEAISNTCKNLQQLAIKPGQNILSGKAIWTMSNLKTLSLFRCNLNSGSAAKGIQNLTNLVYFSSQQNKWVDDKVLSSIGKLVKLQFLRINDSVKVSSGGLLKLIQLKLMETFICQNNVKFYGKDFVTLCENWPRLRKLALTWDEYHHTLPLYISKVTKITHLSIKNSKQFSVEDIQLFTELKSLTIGQCGVYSQQHLSKKFKNKFNIFQGKNVT